MLCAKFGWNWPNGSGEEDFFNSSMYFHNFVIISPWNRAGSFIWINLNPFTQGCFVPSLVEIGQVVLEKKMKMWQVYDNNDDDNKDSTTTTDKFWSEKLNLAFSSGELKNAWMGKWFVTFITRQVDCKSLVVYSIHAIFIILRITLVLDMTQLWNTTPRRSAHFCMYWGVQGKIKWDNTLNQLVIMLAV